MNSYSVYMLESPNGKKYVGLTSQEPKVRWGCGHGYRTNAVLWSDICAYGWKAFRKTILESGLTRDEASDRERHYIALYDTCNPAAGYNSEMGGVHPARLAESTKRKMSLAHIGLERSEAYCRHISESKRGALNGMFGRSGRLNARSRPVFAVTKDGTELLFESMNLANKELNLPEGAFKNIQACCAGRKRTAYGYVWRYAE